MKRKTLLSILIIILTISTLSLQAVKAIDITSGGSGSDEQSGIQITEDNDNGQDNGESNNSDGNSTEEKNSEPIVSITLFETDLREALNEISMQTGVNIILDQTVSGTITADIQGVPLEKALRMVLISGGFTFKKIDDFYFIGLPDTNSRTFNELSELEVVELKYIKVDKILNVLPETLGDYVKGDRQGNVLTINAPPEYYKKIKEIINSLDKPQKQVEVKVLVTEIDSRYLQEYGADLFNFNDSVESSNEISYDMKSNLMVLQTDVYGKLLSRIKLLKEEKKATIEADPKVLLAEGETAELFIGDNQILLLNTENTDIASRIEKVQVGMSLDVTAERVNEDHILLNIVPDLSHFIDTERPDLIIKESSVDTTVSLKDGQTIALAGMTLTDKSFTSKKVPTLSKIPLLRWLFTSEKKQDNESELMIFVTPVIR